ncbi:RcpC/CpaB family pilus assembly protein [Cellulomonas sp. P22]|uniref:RcpC/CpaB family pilus assembly protein n=1 Tax=Cellulomonas sp. P22 TaxID=3373189 RepID=UPI003791FF3E
MPSPVRPRPGVSRSARRPLRLLLWRARLLIAATLVGGACAVTVAELRPPPAPADLVVVAARSLAAGAVLGARDLATARLPRDAAPSGAASTSNDLLGRTVAVDVPAGLPLVEGVVAAPVLEGPPGTVVAPVRFADQGVAALLTPGTRVDVLAAASDGADQGGRSLARSALVLAGPADATTATGLGGLGDTSGQAPPVLLAVSPADAEALAGAGSWATLSPVIVG